MKIKEIFKKNKDFIIKTKFWEGTLNKYDKFTCTLNVKSLHRQVTYPKEWSFNWCELDNFIGDK